VAKIWTKFQLGHPNGGSMQIELGRLKSAIFDKHLRKGAWQGHS